MLCTYKENKEIKIGIAKLNVVFFNIICQHKFYSGTLMFTKKKLLFVKTYPHKN